MTTVEAAAGVPRTSPSTTAAASGTCWSTSTRTPTTRSTSWCASWSASRAGPATTPAELVRRRRRRPVDLRVPRRDDPQHPRVRDATTRDATTILLEQNYRSTQTILTAANAVIARNPDRKPKNLWSEAGDGEQIAGYVAENEHDEAAWVAQRDRRLTDAARRPPGADVAVFYRTNAQSRVFEEVFIRVGLPYKVVGGVRFYERREIRDALAYLRVHRQPRRRRVAAAHPQHARGAASATAPRRCIDALRRARRISFGARARPGRRGARPGPALAERDPALHRR